MAEIIPLGGVTSLDVPIERVLESAKSELKGCVIMGWDKNGDFYAASSYADGGTVLWLMELTKRLLFDNEVEI